MRSLAAVCVALIALLVTDAVLAQDLPDRTPVLLSADEITYDESLGVVVASGHVEISQKDRVLLADTVSYNERTGIVTASGNVSLLEPNGEIMFANYVQLTEDLREGVITNIRLLLTDRSRAAAVAGRKVGNRTELDKGVFSPCELCKDDPTRAPLWQLKAVRIIHDQDTKTIEYHDAWMEIYGIPVAYTPYLSHPDPTVERKSGFLAPTFGGSDELGFHTQIPYFWVIGPDKDATIAPIFTGRQGVVLVGQYRQRVVDGELRLDGSATVAERTRTKAGVSKVEENAFRGHIDADGRFDVDNHWRWGFDLNHATDKTYLRLYDFSNERTLTSRLFTEGFHARNYAAFQAFAFQGLRDSDDNGEMPIVAPLFDYNFVGEPGRYGSYFTLDANAMVLSRVDGRDSRRLSFKGGWTLPYTAPAGDIYTLDASLELDGYHVSEVDPSSDEVDPSGPTKTGFTGRAFPQLAFTWRYPFVRRHENFHEIFEPIAGVVVGPNGGNPGEIPNEDSRDLEFDDTNLFEANRFTGLDRVDGGQRVNYGGRWSLYGNQGAYTSVFLGQSYAFSDNDAFKQGSGVEDQLSDFVGRIEVVPHEYLDLLYRFRFDSDNLKAHRNEVALRAGPPALNLNLTYVFLDAEEGVEAEFGQREELAGTLASQVTDNWSTYVVARRDLNQDEWLYYGLGVTYEDECFRISGLAVKSFYEDEEIQPQTKFLLTVSFKYLGAVNTDF